MTEMDIDGILSIIFPIRGLKCADCEIDKKIVDLKEHIDENISKYIKQIQSKSSNDKEAVYQEIEATYKSENDRKATIESKASSLMTALSLSITILGLSSAILGTGNWELPLWLAIIITILYSLSILYFIGAVYFTVQSFKITGFYTESAKSIEGWLDANIIDLKDFLIANKIAMMELNQNKLLKKSNYLDTANGLFLMGIVFLTLGVLIAIAFHLLGGNIPVLTSVPSTSSITPTPTLSTILTLIPTPIK